MEHIIILGRGGAGKSTFARRLGSVTGLPVIELDEWFWQPGNTEPSHHRWVELQRKLITPDRWIIEGDLGPHDALEPRLCVADTVIVLDFSLLPCAWRSIRRSRERWDYWRWLFGYRRRSLPAIMAMVASHAPRAHVCQLGNRREANALLAAVSS